jgi:hypothetical protein
LELKLRKEGKEGGNENDSRQEVDDVVEEIGH